MALDEKIQKKAECYGILTQVTKRIGELSYGKKNRRNI